ncbi:unnamed protein product [Effrenium voratum]|nr:unnamed protein product [Effrenium voratum]
MHVQLEHVHQQFEQQHDEQQHHLVLATRPQMTSTTSTTNTTTTTSSTSSTTSTSTSVSTTSTTKTVSSTTSVSSTTTTTMVEAVAQRAMLAMSRAEEDVTANLMSSLLESLEGEPLTEPVITNVKSSVGQDLTVAMLTFVAAANQGKLTSRRATRRLRSTSLARAMAFLRFAAFVAVAAAENNLRGDSLTCTGSGSLPIGANKCFGGDLLVEKFLLHVESYDGKVGIVNMKAEGPQEGQCIGAEFQAEDNLFTVEDDNGCGLSALGYDYNVRYCPDQDQVIVNLVKPINVRVVLEAQPCPGKPAVDLTAATSDGTFQPKVSVPLKVLDQLSGGSSAPVAIAMSKMTAQFASDIEAVGLAKAREVMSSNTSAGPSLLGRPLSITVYDSNGVPMDGMPLAEPMTLTISDEANESVACAFYNETTFRWSTAGVRRVTPNLNVSAGTPVPLVCETDHLSIFGGVLNVPQVDMENYEVISFEDSFEGGGGGSQQGGGNVIDNPVDQVVDVVEEVLRCTQAKGIFSPDGMAALGRGAWASSSSAVALWAVLALFFFGCVAAFARDLTRNQTKWMSQLMSLTYPDGQEEDEDEDEAPEDKAKTFSKTCIMLLHSLQAGMDVQSLEIGLVVRTAGSKEGMELKKHKSPLYAAAVKMADVINISVGHVRATTLFLEANWLARMLLLFPAVHRALNAGHGSLVVSRVSRVVMIFTKILSSGALAALFFQGSAQGNDSEAACIINGSLGLTLVLGLAAALVGDVILYGLSALRKQSFKSARSNPGLQLKVKEWRVRDLLFWAITLLALVLSIYVIMVFFATVTTADSDAWAAAALVILLEEFFFAPFLTAAGYALLATYTLEGDPMTVHTLRTAASQVQGQYRAWEGPSAADFRVPMPPEGGNLRALGSAQSAAEAPDVLALGDRQEEEQAAQQRAEAEEQRKLQEQLREQLENQKRQLEQQRQMQVELREQLIRQQQEIEEERRRHRSPPPERPPVRHSQQPWQQDNQRQLPGTVPGTVPLQVPQIVTRQPQQVTSVNLGLQRSVRHGAIVRSGRPGPPSWPPPALRGFDAQGRPLNSRPQVPGMPVPNHDMRRNSRD